MSSSDTPVKVARGQMFPPGYYPDGSMTVLTAIRAHSLRQSYYEVKYDCCGAEGRLSHDAMAPRLRRGALVCSSCALKASVRRSSQQGKFQVPKEGRDDSWDDKEIAQLRKLRHTGHTYRDIAAIMDRSISGIGSKMKRLGLSGQQTKKPSAPKEISEEERQAAHARVMAAKHAAAGLQVAQAKHDKKLARLRARQPYPKILWLEAMLRQSQGE